MSGTFLRTLEKSNSSGLPSTKLFYIPVWSDSKGGKTGVRGFIVDKFVINCRIWKKYRQGKAPAELCMMAFSLVDASAQDSPDIQ